jgi:hypothetical protein
MKRAVSAAVTAQIGSPGKSKVCGFVIFSGRVNNFHDPFFCFSPAVRFLFFACVRPTSERCCRWRSGIRATNLMKVTLGADYVKPVQIHIYAVHWRAPVFMHYTLSKEGVTAGSNMARKTALLFDGENTGWCNISETIYADSGALLAIYPVYFSGDRAAHFNAAIEFANKPDDAAVVKKYNVDYDASTFSVLVPPHLESKTNIENLRSDMESAHEYGAIADKTSWPKVGKKPVKFPFFVTTHLRPEQTDSRIMEREMKTLAYFGFNGVALNNSFDKWGYKYKYIYGPGRPKGTYDGADLEEQKKLAAANYKAYSAGGVKTQDLAFAMLMDEPFGETLAKLATDAASTEGFRAWIKSQNLTPADLLVSSWDEVKPITYEQKTELPALFYYSQKYRTVALGNYMAMQAKLLREQWQGNFPIVSNFSDGAIAAANFYAQGVDYFTLLHDTEQHAIWSEDWGNFSATYQDSSFNVELMRAAARKNGQVMGQYLIAYHGRSGYDTRLKAVSEAARGVKLFKSFMYGPQWTTYESEVWQSVPDAWKDQAAAVHEIGAVEDELLPAMPKKAQVALLYSSSADIWNDGKDWATGFERMHTWLALAHAQIPVDVIGEDDVASGDLAGYKVCYFSDANLTATAAQKLSDWVKSGGTLIMTAGAGERDEFNRLLKSLNALLPYRRNPVEILQKYYGGSGSKLASLKPQGSVVAGKLKFDILAQKQTFADVKIENGTTIKSTFEDGTPAEIQSVVGKGSVICKGYLPALDYIRTALIAKSSVADLSKKIENNTGRPTAEDALLLDKNQKSYNPRQYPAGVRDAIIQSAKDAKVEVPIVCSVPLVDAVYMTSAKGIVIPLANYTLQPIKGMTLDISVDKPFREVRSVYQGVLPFKKIGAKKIRVTLPLECTDFITIH